MKLPFVEALRSKETGRVVPLPTHLSVAVSVDAASAFEVLRDRAIEIRTSATFEVRQLASDSREIPHLQDQARRMLLAEVYGPVSERLRDVLHMLWEAGPQYDDKIAKAIDALIGDLRP